MESVAEPELNSNSVDKTTAVNIRAVFAPNFNLSFYQNSVPILLELAVTNDTDNELKSLKLKLSSSPSFIKSKTWNIDSILAGQKLHISERDLQLDGSMLTRLNES